MTTSNSGLEVLKWYFSGKSVWNTSIWSIWRRRIWNWEMKMKIAKIICLLFRHKNCYQKGNNSDERGWRETIFCCRCGIWLKI